MRKNLCSKPKEIREAPLNSKLAIVEVIQLVIDCVHHN